jgi:hypothetical protein
MCRNEQVSAITAFAGRLRRVLRALPVGSRAARADAPAAAPDMPAIVGELGLSAVRIRAQAHKHHGQIVEGRHPDDSVNAIDLDRHDGMQDIHSHHRHAFSLKGVDEVLPEAVRAAEGYPADAHLWRLELQNGHPVKMEGHDAHHRAFTA